jgi:hypothetical protein
VQEGGWIHHHEHQHLLQRMKVYFNHHYLMQIMPISKKIKTIIKRDHHHPLELLPYDHNMLNKLFYPVIVCLLMWCLPLPLDMEVRNHLFFLLVQVDPKLHHGQEVEIDLNHHHGQEVGIVQEVEVDPNHHHVQEAGIVQVLGIAQVVEVDPNHHRVQEAEVDPNHHHAQVVEQNLEVGHGEAHRVKVNHLVVLVVLANSFHQKKEKK